MPKAPATTRPSSSAALVSFVLQAHLPWVINHGTWPHGMEWLHEAAAETYLPLLRMLKSLASDGVPFHATLVLSPVLLEQLAHPVFLDEFPRYLDRKITAAEEDAAFFEQSGELHYAYLARLWRDRFLETRDDLRQLGEQTGQSPIVSGIRRFQDSGHLSTLTSCATHGYLPLLGTDESIRAQIRLAVATHERHLGSRPRGIWSPECGYRPSGPWQQPVPDAGASAAPPPFDRPGLETFFAAEGLSLFFADTHLIESAEHTSPSSRSGVSPLYQPFRLSGSPVAVFPRDSRTGTQVWSADGGYPGEPAYLDFYKKRWPGGHRYWRVTDWHTGMGEKQPYVPEAAAERVQAHARHFAHLLREILAPAVQSGSPAPVLTAPYDAELFGHWWYEGTQWLEAVARTLAAPAQPGELPLQLSSAVDALSTHPPTEEIQLSSGSWGAGGDDRVWFNDETHSVWQEIYRLEHRVRTLSSDPAVWKPSALATRVLQQLCRELLLLESSDWPFLITTGAARDYAEARLRTHLDQIRTLEQLWLVVISPGSDPAATDQQKLTPDQLRSLEEIERRDNLFPGLDPALWAEEQPS